MKKSIIITILFLFAVTLAPALAQAPEGEEYIVQADDWLSKIAEKAYGDVLAFPAIVEATNAKAAEDDSFAVIDDPDIIEIGQKLWLPAEVEGSALTPAPAPGERVTAAIELTTNPWLWTSFTDPVEQFDLDNPEAYTVSFNSDGSLNVVADCNNASGTYTADDDGLLSIEIGPTTLAACPPESRSEEFLQKLGFVSNFFFENGFLYLDTMADGGTFQLASASEHMPASADQSFNLETISCPATLNFAATAENEVEGETYECGVIKVPENYADPAAGTIELVYVRLFSPSASPAADPVLYLSGGPGGSALSEVSPGGMLIQNLQLVRQNRDVVTYDQRGTGRSNALLCGPTQAAIGYAAELLPDLSEEIQTIVAEDEDPADILNIIICAQGYMAAGVDLTQYNSIVSSHDMASLMTALGYDQYNLYGTSYGTKLAQVALRETPDRIRSVVLDGATPITGAVAATSGIEQQEQYVRLFEQCAADAACNAAYPNLAERFGTLLDQVEATPITIDPPIQPSGLPVEIMRSLSTGIDTIDTGFFRMLASYNNASANVLYASAGFNVLVDQMPRLILAVEEGDIEYVRTYFEAPPLSAGGEEVVESVVNILDANDIIPDNPLIAKSLETLLTEAQTAVDTDGSPEANWVGLVVNELAARLQAGEEQTDVLRDMLSLAVLPAKGHEASLLTDYANEHLSEATADQANEIAAAMSSADVRATMWHINDIAAAMSFTREQVGGLHELVTYAVNCPESVVHHSQADVDAAVAAAEYPQLDGWKDSTGFPFFTTVCGYFPPSNIDRSFLDPINSNAPALIIEGALDTHTPPSEAQEITTYLQNSKYVEFKSEGHVVSAKHPSCPGTIAAQFLDDPTSDLDTSCTDEFVIEFELP